MAERLPAVGFVIEVDTCDGHRLNLAVPDGSKVKLLASLGFPGKYARPTLHVHAVEQGSVREVALWPDLPPTDQE